MKASSIVLLAAAVSAQEPGQGISKSTYSANNPIPGKAFLEKYFPVAIPGDECDNDICICPKVGSTPEWYIQQGRVYAKKSIIEEVEASVEASRRQLQSPGNGFGLHLVNVSNHLTTGGMSTAEVEAEFVSKLGNMATFDSFMDFNVLFYTTALEEYAAAFDKDNVPYHTIAYTDEAGASYTSLILHVPNTQMVLELTSDKSLKASSGRRAARVARPAERRASARALALVIPYAAKLGASASKVIHPIAVNRAVSTATFAKLEDFYVTGMGTKLISSEADAETNYAKKCFLWPGATVDVCFYQRDDSATKGDWKVGDFEKMLNTVHKNIIVGHPLCGVDKWFDNHYAIDSMTADTSKIIKYIDANDVPHVCNSDDEFGTSLAYAFDPTGWGIQLDLGFNSAPSDCSSAHQARLAKLLLEGKAPEVQGTFNPACGPYTGKCP